MDIASLLELFYNVHSIPIYVYKESILIHHQPRQQNYFFQNAVYDELKQIQDTFLIHFSPDNTIWGYINDVKKNRQFLLGPVNIIPYSDQQLKKMCYQNYIPKSEHEEYCLFHKSIPNLSQLQVLDLLLLFNYLITGEKLSRDNIFAKQENDIFDTGKQTYYKERSYSSDFEEIYPPDTTLPLLIGRGDVKELYRYFRSKPANILDHMTFASTTLQHRKNLCYYSIAVFSEIAKQNGFPIMDCLRIVSSYYRTISNAQSIEIVDSATSRAAILFAQKVADLKIPQDTTPTLIDCLQFIRKNIYYAIHVTDVAEYAGYSTVHLERLFKKELGFTPSQYIMKVKLLEAKDLLIHSSKTIVEISNSLCFSSQSHFHRCFKKEFNKTPLQFKKLKC